MIVQENEKLEEVSVRGITCNKAEAKITINAVPDKPGVAAKIFTQLANSGINVDTIVQNVSHTKLTDISFTVPGAVFTKGITITKKIAKRIGAGEVTSDENIARVSIVGSGMRSHSGIAAKMFKTLAEKKINIEMISTSEISISCIINYKHVNKAVKSLHKKFNLAGTK